MSNVYYDILYVYEKKMFLGILDDAQKVITDFEQITYTDHYADLKPTECCIVMIAAKDGKRQLTPVQNVALLDEDGQSVALGLLDIETVLESVNNVYRDIHNIIKFH